MLRITDVVKHLLIINIVLYIVTATIMPDARGVLGLAYPTSPHFQPFQLVTHMFMHADTNHLFMNMLGLFFFGPALEMHFGPKRFLFYYLFTGFGAMILQLLMNYIEIHYFGGSPAGLWGASGSIFGLLAGFAMINPNQVIRMIFPPIAMKAKYFVLIFAAIELYSGVCGANTGVAHFAHLGGALFGILIILYWRNQRGRAR